MSAERNGARPERLAATVLPWLVAGAGFLVYLGTLNQWVSLRSLPSVARTSGWLWQPDLVQPVTRLVFYPFGFLPERWIPLALNLLSAGCGALVLLVLARSVALLPHDRTHDQRLRESSRHATLSLRSAWMPPVLAAMACGLQLTFWERATAGTGDMINLLIFAGVIWCLLEFRLELKQSWLFGSAFLFAAGMANDWTMIGYFPFFIAAIVWLKGLSFFQLRFLLRMTVCGLAGLCLYLLLPTFCTAFSVLNVGFWAALKANLRLQRDALVGFPRDTLLMLALTSLLPLVVISIRWGSQQSHSGDDSRVGAFVTRAMFHLAHAAFLAVSLWIALDPPASPRHLGAGVALLTQYYLSALVIGYCFGYFLLIGSAPVCRAVRSQQAARVEQFLANLTVAVSWVLLAGLPLALVWRNLGQIRTTNGPALREFARQLHRSLPAGRSVVLSDDPTQLFLLQAELDARRHDDGPLLLDTTSLAWGQYQILKASQFKSRWPVAPPTNGLEVMESGKLLQLISGFSRHEPVIYLHPSFSRCYELFGDRPNGAVHYLVPRRSDTLSQLLDGRAAAANEQYWQELWGATLQTLARQTNRKPDAAPPPAGQLAASLNLEPEPNSTASFLGCAYAKCLDDWGVRMQRLGRWKEAGVWFRRALELEPDNLPAQINLEFNQRYQVGTRQRLDRESVQKRFLDLFTRHRKWEAVVNDDGPVDEPTFLFETARVLLGSGNPHQAIQAFARCAELAPDWLDPKLWLAQAYVVVREFGSALSLTDGLEVSDPPQDGTGMAQLLFCRATALEGLGRTNEAAACIDTFVAKHQEQDEVLSIAAQLYLQSMQFQPALAVLDRLLDREPQNPGLLSNKGLAEMQLTRYDAAVATLTTALFLAPSNQVVRLNRAIACLRAGQLDAACADYQTLLASSPSSYKVLFGLGEIAWRRQDTNAAIRYYQRCLPLGNPASAEYREVAARLKLLQGQGSATLRSQY